MGVPFEYVFNSSGQIDKNLGNVSKAFCSPPRGTELDLDGDDKDLQEVLEIEKYTDVKVLNVIAQADGALCTSIAKVSKEQRNARVVAIEDLNQFNKL
jgi:hypothetical protein